jgi:hypothetical protein
MDFSRDAPIQIAVLAVFISLLMRTYSLQIHAVSIMEL